MTTQEPRVESMWREFAGSVLYNLGPRELRAARTVFYAGGASMLAYMIGELSKLPEGEAGPVIDAMQAEFAAVFGPAVEH